MTPPLARWPELHSHWRQAVSAARALNRAGLSAFPLRALPVLSVETPTEYASNPGIVGPERRRLVRRALLSVGYVPLGPRLLGADGWPALLEHPAPPDSLLSDPTWEAGQIVTDPSRIALLTPTQTVLLLVRMHGGRMEPPLQQELLHLVWEQGVDLSAVALWAGAAGHRRLFTVLPALWTRHFQGRELRRRGEFRSLLPR